MRCKRPAAIARAFIAPVFCTLVLAFVAASPAWAANSKKYAKLFNAAEAHVTAGRIEPALVAFSDAAKVDPTRKEPWVRSAQLLFDSGRYGRAIVAAEEVLHRDPQDLVADSVLTIAGMRLAGQSLQRLQASGALAVSDTARKEAEQLASAVRVTLDKAKPEVEAPRPPPRKVRKSRASKSTARAAADSDATPTTSTRPADTAPRTPPKPAAGGANPFDVLNR